jgi:REP element-mobilizing transposase RayT
MARKLRLFAPGVLYHVIVRGNQRQKTFSKDRDYQVYLEKLAQYCKRYGVTLYAYCLMPNHVHLLLECSSFPLGKFMQGLQQSYTQYYNRTYNKVGHLFQGRYKAILCQKDAYLLELVRYIHLNAVRSKLVSSAEKYPYSGEQAYRTGKPTLTVDPRRVLKMIGGVSGYRRFVQEGLGEGHQEHYYEVEDQRFLGEGEFGEGLRREYEHEERPRKKRSLAQVIAEMAKAVKIRPERLRDQGRARGVSRQRTMLAYVLVRRGGYSVKEVARYFGRDPTTISSLLSRYERQIPEQSELARQIDRLTRFV